MKFTKLYEDVKASDLFKPFSPEKVAELKAAYPEVKLKDAIDSADKTKLADGTWHVHEDLNLAHYELITLKNLNVSIVDDNFNCSYNHLTSLEGAPNIVHGNFNCSYNHLTNLRGAPIEVNSHFSAYQNQLTDLEGAPASVVGNFWCNTNKLISLNGAPTKVGENFYCFQNSKKFTKDEVKAVCDVKGKIITSLI